MKRFKDLSEEAKADVVWWVSLVVTLLMLMATCAGCSRVQYVPVERVQTKYEVRDSIRYDSIYRLDSVYIHSGKDTVYKERYKYLYKYMFLNKSDTVYRSDTIQVPYPIEAKLTKWQEFKLRSFDTLVGAVLLGIVVWLIWVRMKR